MTLACACLAACGTPGAPRPPSLRLPETVRDLAATRQGSSVTLSWTEPERTTDGETIRALGPTLVCMGVNDFPMTHCDQVVADLSLKEYAQCTPQRGKPATCTVTLPEDIQQQNPRGQATYAVEALNTNGRSAGLSNQVRVPTAPTVAPPTELSSEIRDSVAITAKGTEPQLPPGLSVAFHLVRRQAAGANIDLGTASGMSGCGPVAVGPDGRSQGPCGYARVFQDRSFEWEKTYFYHVVAVTTVSLPDGTIFDVGGEPSEEVKVFTHDVYPPLAPRGLQAVASGVGQPPFIDLTWAPNTESDLAGYNLYRREEGQPPVRINNEMLITPSFRDATAQAGKTYFYSVSAVDLRGNESSKSQEASETLH